MVEVRGYTLSTCPWCNKTKKFFADHGIKFNFVDYDLASPDEKSRIEKEISKYKGHTAFPYVIINDTVVVGYNPEKWSKLLALN